MNKLILTLKHLETYLLRTYPFPAEPSTSTNSADQQTTPYELTPKQWGVVMTPKQWGASETLTYISSHRIASDNYTL
jgi:hypothetical protein